MEDMQLYDMALKSVKRYKESGEILTDFDDFMGEIEKEYSTRTYKVILAPAGDGYMVTVPDFKCNTQGKDIPEALHMAADAIKTMAAALKDMGREIPEPDSVSFRAEPKDIIKHVRVKFL